MRMGAIVLPKPRRNRVQDGKSPMNPSTSEHRIAPYPKKTAELGGKRMAYVELGAEPDGGAGPVFLFLQRQPDLVLSVARRHAGGRGNRALHRARPDRHGRF